MNEIDKGLVVSQDGTLVLGSISKDQKESLQQGADTLNALSSAAATESSKVKEIAVTDEQMHILCTRIHSLVDRVVQNDVSVLVFLDKSARPLVTLFLSLHKSLYPGKQIPIIKFVDINAPGLSASALRLPKEKGKQHIIVDDIEFGGIQKRKSMNFFQQIDSENVWSFWGLLEDQADRAVFSSTPGYPQMPWHATQYGTLVKDHAENGIFAQKEEDRAKRRVGLQLRRTMRLGAEQYVKSLKKSNVK